MSMIAYRFWDPLYGPIGLTQYEMDLSLLPEVQRLRYIRLCNINSLLITGASEVNRFEHSIGVLRLVKEWLASHRVSTEDAECLIAASLLHDVQTGPFGHSIQYILEDNELEDEFEHENLDKGEKEKYYQRISFNASFAGRAFKGPSFLGSKWDKVTKLIRGDGALGKLISGIVDLDNIDNVIRLAYHIGIASREDGEAGIQLARDMELVDGQLTVSKTSTSYIERWQSIRKRLYELLLLDWGEFSAKAMLTRAFEDATLLHLVGADTWQLTDSELLHEMEKASIGEAQSVKNLISRLRAGRLYFPVVLLRSSSIERYSDVSTIKKKRAIEKEIRERCSGRWTSGNVLIHPILDYSKTERSVEVSIRETSEKLIIGNDSKSLLLGVFTSSRPETIKERDAMKKAVLDTLAFHSVADTEDILDPMGDIEPIQGQLRLL